MDYGEDELLALKILEITEQEETVQQKTEEPPAKNRGRGAVSKLLGDLFEKRGKIHYIPTVCQRNTKLKRHLTQILLSGGANEGQSTYVVPNVYTFTKRFLTCGKECSIRTTLQNCWRCHDRKVKLLYI